VGRRVGGQPVDEPPFGGVEDVGGLWVDEEAEGLRDGGAGVHVADGDVFERGGRDVEYARERPSCECGGALAFFSRAFFGGVFYRARRDTRRRLPRRGSRS
jgi:hypothetical protein